MAEGHLDTDGHSEIAETVEWYCSDQIPSGSQRVGICTPPATRWKEKFTGSSGGKSRQRTDHPADLFDLTSSRDRAADP